MHCILVCYVIVLIAYISRDISFASLITFERLFRMLTTDKTNLCILIHATADADLNRN